MAKYVKPKEAAEIQGLNERTLRRWEGDGRIEAIRTPSGQRRYNIESYTAKSGRDSRKVVAYARVSGRAQQSDLDRLFATLSSLYRQAEVVSEIGGGLNFKRKKLLALLERILSGDVRLVVVAHFDNQAELTGTTVLDVTEEFTSKTCTRCGHVHARLGGSKVFHCPSCGLMLLRDWNGALGIFLKALRDNASITFAGDSAIVALSGDYRINVE